jgi:hypothetical protein
LDRYVTDALHRGLNPIFYQSIEFSWMTALAFYEGTEDHLDNSRALDKAVAWPEFTGIVGNRKDRITAMGS